MSFQIKTPPRMRNYFFFFSFLCFFAPSLLLGQNAKDRDYILKNTDTLKLKQLAQKFKNNNLKSIDSRSKNFRPIIKLASGKTAYF
jgi:hypothetical protein